MGHSIGQNHCNSAKYDNIPPEVPAEDLKIFNFVVGVHKGNNECHTSRT